MSSSAGRAGYVVRETALKHLACRKEKPFAEKGPIVTMA
jgi:hypothetical protein